MRESGKGKVDEDTIIPVSLGLLKTGAVGLVGITAWLITLSVNQAAQRRDIDAHKAAQDDAVKTASIAQKEYIGVLHSIDTRLSVIEARVKAE